MQLKTCFKCNLEKPIDDFFNYPDLFEREFENCSKCRSENNLLNKYKLSTSTEFLEKERARHREKYYRLNYKEKHKPTPVKKKEIMARYKFSYPEKLKAKNKSQRIPCTKGNNLHHWSYNEEHWKDVIEVNVADHNLLHRHIDYDQSTFMYRNKNGELLDTRESHIKLLESLK